jgi:GntR family transcriptional regulator
MSVRTLIDKSSWVPYYAQLRDSLEADIRSGRLEWGTQLPSEAELCEEWDVSRTVVRQALMELTHAGLITRVKGKGSFVAPPKVDERLAQSLVGLAEEVSARGQQLQNQILLFERQTPPQHVAEILGLAPDEPVVRLDRLRSIDGTPWVVTSTYLPYDPCAPLLELDMRQRSLYATLEKELGLVVDHGRRTIEAALAGPEHANLLGIEASAPVLVLKSVGYLAEGRPIEYFIAWHRGDRSRFEVELQRNRGHVTGVLDADGRVAA